MKPSARHLKAVSQKPQFKKINFSSWQRLQHYSYHWGDDKIGNCQKSFFFFTNQEQLQRACPSISSNICVTKPQYTANYFDNSIDFLIYIYKDIMGGGGAVFQTQNWSFYKQYVKNINFQIILKIKMKEKQLSVECG